MKRLRIPSSAGDYLLLCGRGLLRRRGWLLRQLPGGHTAIFLISSPRVWRHWGAALQRACGATARPILFDDREKSKNLDTVERLNRALVRAGADRGALLVAMGGGVVGDVAGFAAASYMRGVALVHIPTTLVAQVDSSIGGKTGVNLPEGKNLVGAFYPPRLIVTDAELLATLPEREYRSGLYEVVKYGIISDPELFNVLERAGGRVLRRDAKLLDWMVLRCARQKARIVGADEKEGGLRRILNFGHTIGHALEAAAGYGRIWHGEAVGWGMLAAIEIARRGGRVGAADANRMRRLILSLGPLPSLPRRRASIAAHLGSDKKTRAGRLRWVLPRRIGKVEITEAVPALLVRQVLDDLDRLGQL